MTCRFLKRTYLRMRGKEETRIACSQGVPTWDLPSRCEDCAMREDNQVLVCAQCGKMMPDGRAKAWIGGSPYCSECADGMLDVPDGREGLE